MATTNPLLSLLQQTPQGQVAGQAAGLLGGAPQQTGTQVAAPAQPSLLGNAQPMTMPAAQAGAPQAAAASPATTAPQGAPSGINASPANANAISAGLNLAQNSMPHPAGMQPQGAGMTPQGVQSALGGGMGAGMNSQMLMQMMQRQRGMGGMGNGTA
jgi:hypothetical protein